ncbi:MAG TPA: DUF397 domain-containing protein [Spirillospora sp.]|nr:DUF397 domain-containing protein [Spirillospora sp.]
MSSDESATLWRRSSQCAGNGACVVVAGRGDGTVSVRDAGIVGPRLDFRREEWRRFLVQVRQGRYDHP